MKFIRTLAVTGLVAIAGAGCADLDVTNLNAPDRARAIATANDVENLIAGAFQTWWGVVHYSYPSSALSVGADAHSSSWGNWGMRDFGWEPRKAYDNSPSYGYRGVVEVAWYDLYTALSAVSDGLKAIDGGIEIGIDGADTQRAIFFGKVIQALSLGYLAVLYDKGWVLDENTDLEALNADSFQEPAEVWAAAVAKFDEAIALANGGAFSEIPSAWVGYAGDWDPAYAVNFLRGYRARLQTQMARTPAERDALNWNAIMADAMAGIQDGEDYGGEYDATNWTWMRQKLHTAGIAGWARLDVRTYGPSDASGNYAAWLGTADPELRNAINIQTVDSRVTGQVDTDGDGETYDEDGSLIGYLGASPFPASRGTYHYSHYIYTGWTHLSTSPSYVGFYPDLTYDEMQYIIAEAQIRTGNDAAAMAIINDSRANGGLPAFTDPAGVAPGGADCVPKPVGTTCGDLLEALKYEKRIDLFHYGLGTEYFDDRGWGDLVPGTPLELPVPGAELELLLAEIYTFGGTAGNAAPNIVGDISPEGIRIKREALERYNASRQEEIQATIVR